MQIQVLENILKLNDDVAAQNRSLLASKKIFTIDLMGGPGCGKTTLVESTLAALNGEMRIAVIVGDLTTARDAERIGKLCTQTVQINTGKGCHLEAHQVRQAMARLNLDAVDLLIIENVGNLVCPVGFDLGQDAKVGMFCTTEGADKPAKYPYMVAESDLVLVNKIDLLPYLSYDLPALRSDIRRIKPSADIMECSALKADFARWLDWLRVRRQAKVKG